MRFAFTIAVLVSFTASAQTPKTDDEKSLYAIGYIVGSRNLASLSLKPHELELVKRGLTDGATGKKAQVDPEPQMEKINALVQARSSAQANEDAWAEENMFRMSAMGFIGHHRDFAHADCVGRARSYCGAALESGVREIMPALTSVPGCSLWSFR